MQLRWISTPRTTPIYTAQQIASANALIDATLHDQLNDSTRELIDLVREVQIPQETFWNYALPLSPAFEEYRKLARMILYRCLDAEASRSPAVEKLESALQQLMSNYLEHAPTIEEDLPLRVGPLREQWESRGPGMLRMIAELTDPKLIAGKADVILVQPVRGGGGSVSLTYNSVAFEAVLANPHGQLPEIVRLAWMLSQINGDLPMFTEEIAPERVNKLSALAMLVPTLAAADHVDLVSLSDDLLRGAIELWEIDSDELAGKLTFWWNAYVQSRPPWPAALQELDRIL